MQFSTEARCGPGKIVEPMNAEVRVKCIQDHASFRSLEHGWNGLLQESTANTIFLTWEWLYTWFRHLNGDRRLCILSISQGEETIGLIPLVVSQRILDRVLGVQAVELLGTGRAGADYLDFIIRRGYEEQAFTALEHFAKDTGLILMLDQIKKDCFAAQWATHLECQGWRVFGANTTVCPYTRLGCHSWQSYLATLGSEHRSTVQRKLRNLAKHFDVQFERVASESQRREALSLLIRLHNQRWDGRSGAFSTSGLVSFHEDFTRLALALGWLRLFVLRLNGKPAASLYGLRYNNIFYFYQSAFDTSYGKHSVGLVTMALSIKAAIEEGAQEYDLLHGDERYKFHWAKEVREIQRVNAFPEGAIGTVYQGVTQVSRRLNQELNRLARYVLKDALADEIACRIRDRNFTRK